MSKQKPEFCSNQNQVMAKVKESIISQSNPDLRSVTKEVGCDFGDVRPAAAALQTMELAAINRENKTTFDNLRKAYQSGYGDLEYLEKLNSIANQSKHDYTHFPARQLGRSLGDDSFSPFQSGAGVSSAGYQPSFFGSLRTSQATEAPLSFSTYGQRTQSFSSSSSSLHFAANTSRLQNDIGRYPPVCKNREDDDNDEGYEPLDLSTLPWMSR